MTLAQYIDTLMSMQHAVTVLKLHTQNEKPLKLSQSQVDTILVALQEDLADLSAAFKVDIVVSSMMLQLEWWKKD